MLHSGIGVESEAAIAREERRLVGPGGAFDREKTHLGRHAAAGREAPRLAAGGENAVAGNDDGEWVSSERLPDRPCGSRDAHARSNLAVGERRPGPDASRLFVDAAVEGWNAVHVERHLG